MSFQEITENRESLNQRKHAYKINHRNKWILIKRNGLKPINCVIQKFKIAFINI